MSYHLLTERQKLILALVIREYSKSAMPVGSKRLTEDYDLDFSPATIRNEMVSLSEAGLLRQPHTSAGRVPTEEGYRYFVGQIMGHTELPQETRRTITHQFYQAGRDSDQWMRLAASVLATQSQAAALVTAPKPTSVRFKHLELISIRGGQVLMVLVLSGGEVRQQMLTLAEAVPQPQLSAAADRITQRCIGLGLDAIRTLPEPAESIDADIMKLIVETVTESTQLLDGEVFRDGITNVLAEPEFSNPDRARNALRVLEERPFLENILTRTMTNAEVGVVQVLIGGEGTWEELSNCSIVYTRYGVPELATGLLGVLGPIRMPYTQTISTVRFVASLLGEFVMEINTD